MKKKALFLIAAALSLTFLFAACGNNDENIITEVESESPGDPEPVDSDKEYRIELEGNATTGYRWMYKADPEGIVEEVSNDYIVEGDDGEAGTPGTFVFVFEGVKEGETTLEFRYARAWEDEDAQSVSYTLSVDADGVITG